MQFGVHLPLVGLDDAPRTLERLSTYARRAADLDFRFLCANDHLVFRRPWLDGPTALAAVLRDSGSMTIATTVALPVIRGPAQTAKLLAALETLSAGRLLAGVGPGSSAGTTSPPAFRSPSAGAASTRPSGHFAGCSAARERFRGTFYATEDMDLDRGPAGSAGPPLWIASWGSEAGLRRVAELGDGWLASAYNTTPHLFRQALGRLAAAGKPATTFPTRSRPCGSTSPKHPAPPTRWSKRSSRRCSTGLPRRSARSTPHRFRRTMCRADQRVHGGRCSTNLHLAGSR